MHGGTQREEVISKKTEEFRILKKWERLEKATKFSPGQHPGKRILNSE
jgi:hypothetical protein